MTSDPGYAVDADGEQLELSIDTRADGPDLIAAIAGQIDYHTAGDIREKLLDPASDPDVGRLVLDLSGVGFCDSSGLGALIALHKARLVTGKPLVLTKVRPTLRHLLRLTNLEQVFTLTESD